jgi:hypothetical protein
LRCFGRGKYENFAKDVMPRLKEWKQPVAEVAAA